MVLRYPALPHDQHHGLGRNHHFSRLFREQVHGFGYGGSFCLQKNTGWVRFGMLGLHR